MEKLDNETAAFYSEIFRSIQGEGRFMGIPSVFVRFSYCNLRCRWCDTPYTSWEPERKRVGIRWVIEEIEKLMFDHHTHVVITGGEPMLQQRALQFLCANLANYNVTIETNGCYAPQIGYAYPFMSISPKLLNSLPHEADLAQKHNDRRLNPDAITELMENYDHQFKFVIDTPDDVEEVHAFCEALRIDLDSVYLMSQAQTRDELHAKQKWLVPICVEQGFNYSHRLQVEIWGNKRGA